MALTAKQEETIRRWAAEGRDEAAMRAQVERDNECAAATPCHCDALEVLSTLTEEEARELVSLVRRA